MYEKVSKPQHQNFTVIDNGLFIDPKWPYIGAFPDGIICCPCCGKGALEIKCPCCHKGEAINSAAASDKKFCLKETDGKLHLDTDHIYVLLPSSNSAVCV